MFIFHNTNAQFIVFDEVLPQWEFINKWDHFREKGLNAHIIKSPVRAIEILRLR